MSEFQISPSENILKLRKLTEQICDIEPSGGCVIEKLKNAIEIGYEEISSSKTEKTRFKKYEKMFLEIKKIITEN